MELRGIAVLADIDAEMNISVRLAYFKSVAVLRSVYRSYLRSRCSGTESKL